ncbi:ankyrin and het domain protein [Stagonosporopsis vannaccii]|nr:ankyrin and het domain protein [Stagonosporopsis vannaccii]
MDTYEYSDLPADEFRYLVLSPGVTNDPLSCSLHTSRVDDVQYEAVSYVWGTDQRDCDIVCDGRVLKIIPNLYRVLQRVRLPDAPRNIWADSICINQEDLQEKGRQVTMMGQIYRNAERVLICMGTSGEEHGPDVFTLLEDVRNMIDDGVSYVNDKLREYTLSSSDYDSVIWDQFPYSNPSAPVLHDPRWNSINALIEQSWFQRGWVVREAGLARQAIVLWGQTEFLWHDLMRALVWRHRRAVKSIAIPAEDRFRSHLEAFEARHRDSIRVFYQWGSWKACSLLDYLHFARALRLTDPRDRIYAFLDLAEDSVRDLRVVPNYNDAPSKVYRDFAMSYVRTFEDVDILNYVKHDESSVHAGHMSWAPDWSKSEDNFTGFVSTDDNHPPLLSCTMQATKPRLVDGTTLEVDGVIHDSVRCVFDVLQSSTTTPLVLFELWESLRRSISDSPYLSSHLLEPFFDALTNLGYIGELNTWHRERRAYIDIFERHFASKHEQGLAAWGKHETSRLESSTLHGFIVSATSGKRVIVTERGYIGTAPAVTQKGDLCAIIFGCSSPCLLRKSESLNGYIYLGPGTVPGKSLSDLDDYGVGFYEYAHTAHITLILCLAATMEGSVLLVDAIWATRDEPYHYDTLPRGEYFRYLVLQPGSGDDGLKCSLHITALGDTEYEAISYVWGTEFRDHDISCDGRKLKITKNLHDALQRLRYPTATRKLWADSICIHQQDIEEKSHQVANMGRIYAEAQRVLLYMGADPSKLAPDVDSLLKDMRNSFECDLANYETSTWDLIPFPQWDDPILFDDRWGSLEIFLHLPWFKRGWVVREAGLARDCLVIWGEREFSWTNLMWVSHWLMGRGVTIASLPSSYHPLKAHMDAYSDRHVSAIRVFYNTSWSPNHLLDYIYLGRFLEFKDRRDSLFAFFDLAIDSANELRLMADYRQSPLEVFRTFATQYLRTTGDASILDYVRHETRLPQSDIPTWIPTWDAVERDQSTTDLSYLMGRPGLLPRNGAALKPKVLNDEFLRVHGVIFDSISFLTEPLKSSTTTPKFVYRLWLCVEAASRSLVYPREKLSEVFITALIRGWWGVSEEYASCAAAYADQLNKLPVQAENFQWIGDNELRRKLQFMQDLIEKDVHDKRFMITKRGYMGLVPSAACQDDLCAILFGCRFSCMLRSSEKRSVYKYVGSAYIRVSRYGALKGEKDVDMVLGSSTESQPESVGVTSSPSRGDQRLKDPELWGLMGTERFKHWADWDVEEQDIILC